MKAIFIGVLSAGCGLLPGGAHGSSNDMGGDMGSGMGSGSGSGSASVSPLVNVLRVGAGDVPISGGVAVQWSGSTLTTFDPATGMARGQRALSAGTIAVLGTGDLDGDGLADVSIIETAAAAAPCASGALDRTLMVVSGAKPSSVLYQTTLPDACISLNGASPTPYISLWEGAVDMGIAGWLAVSPQYYSEGWLVGASPSTFYTAETAAFDTYQAARPLLQPGAGGHTYMTFQQPMNGMIASVGGVSHYVAATSGRFLQFAIAPLSSQQLVADSPFLARTDLVGRTYGLLQQDAGGDPRLFHLISGTASSDLYSDVIAGSASNTVAGTDLWAAIERHVSMLDAVSGSVVQQFYSYAHDAQGCCSDAYTYRNRITYPSYALLPSASGPSRTIYNVFDGATWNVHISAPGGVASATVLANYYVWDVIPRGPDEVDVLASPIDLSRQIYVPDYIVANTSTVGSWRYATYFPRMTTSVFRWTRTAEHFAEVKHFDGIPRLDLGFPRARTQTASSGRLYPSQRVAGDAGSAVLLITTANLLPGEQPIDW